MAQQASGEGGSVGQPEGTSAAILVVDDELGMREGCRRALTPLGHVVDTADDLAAARTQISESSYDLVLLDVMMPDGRGIDLIDLIHDRDPDTICIIITGYATVELAVEAVRRGAYDFLSKPFSSDLLIMAVDQGLERRRLSLEAKRLAALELESQDLARAKAELERLDETKSQLMLKLAHELRAPVAAVKSYLNLIQGGYVDDDEMLPTIERAGERLQVVLDLIGDLLELARLKQTSDHLQRGMPAQDVASIAEAVCDMFRPQALEKNQSIQVKISQRPTVAADPDRLRQIWTNLISNAIKYTPEGGIISVSLQTEEDHFVGAVRDTGIGISKADQQHLFQEFFRTEQARETGEMGTGLGLSIVKEIVEGYGGDMEVSSRLGKGTTFRFRLPLSPLSPGSSPAAQ
jgi:signal transduction histidine kinase